MDCKNIKKDTCHISFKSIIWSLPYFLTVANLYRGAEQVGNFLKEGKKPSEQRLDDSLGFLCRN